MKATFLVEIETHGDTDLFGLADDIKQACEAEGITVNSAKPWSRPTLSGVSLPTQTAAPSPNNTTQQNTQ